MLDSTGHSRNPVEPHFSCQFGKKFHFLVYCFLLFDVLYYKRTNSVSISGEEAGDDRSSTTPAYALAAPMGSSLGLRHHRHLWLIDTDQIKTSRPRRNDRSSRAPFIKCDDDTSGRTLRVLPPQANPFSCHM